MQPSGNTAQNNELLAQYARYWEAPESKRPAIEREIDALLGCGTRRTDALERKTVSFKEEHAGAQVLLGDRTELMKARIARHDKECQGDQFVGGMGVKGLREIAKSTAPDRAGGPDVGRSVRGYSLKQLKTKIREPSAGFIYAIEGGRLTMPGSVTCVRSAFWATCPLSGQEWGKNMRLETRTNRQGMVPGWSAGAIWHISGPALPDALPTPARSKPI